MERQFISVHALTQYIRLKFEKDKYMKNVCVEGEIADINCRNGNYYLRVKDNYAILPCVIFSQYVTEEITTLQIGDAIKIVGDISVYMKNGTYQLYAFEAEKDGVGNLHKLFEKVKAKLLEEGLFNQENKIALPQFPRKVGLITANNSAALQDMLITLQRRYPLCQPVFFPSAMQGEKAVANIVKQLKKADASDVDVIVLARGGGSYEDLQAFNDEQVARKIFEMQKPIITGIGHEIDVTIADFVADVRAATPTAAIETITPEASELKQELLKQQARLQQAITYKIELLRQHVLTTVRRLKQKRPEQLLQREKAVFQYLMQRMISDTMKMQVITKKQSSLVQQEQELFQQMLKTIQTKKQQLRQMQEKLEMLSPLEVLSRGYAIAQKDESIIQSIGDVIINDKISVVLKDGTLQCLVEKIDV